MDTDTSQTGPMRLAALIAHQLKSPLSAVQTHLQTLLDGYAGDLAPRQADVLARAMDRCRQAAQSVEHTLAIARMLEDPASARGRGDFVQEVAKSVGRQAEAARRAQVALTTAVDVAEAYVPLRPEALSELLDALLGNAVKYTPQQGRVRVALALHAADATVALRVSDSGVGIPEAERERVFDAFYRASTAAGSTRPGTGLGLAFVKAVVDSVNGKVAVVRSADGGSEFVVTLPLADEPAARDEQATGGLAAMGDAINVVIIGGVAAGPKVASKLMRLNPKAKVTVVEKGEFLSYAGCGLPYYVSGVVHEQKELMATPLGVVRDPVFFQKMKSFEVKNHTEAVHIDREKKSVRVRDQRTGEESDLPYDKLVLATGASPIIPPIEGTDLKGVFTLHGVMDAEGVKALLAERKARDVVVIGGGLIGVETTEAMVECGCRVTVVEMMPQVLGMLDWEMAQLVTQHMEAHGVKVLTGTKALAIEGHVGDEDHVGRVRTDQGVLPADMVVLSIGVRPQVSLARDAGLAIGEKTGAIVVDDHMRTTDPDIYAAGDCVENRHLVTGQPVFVPLGSTANKQGRVVANNLAGREDTWPGVLGATICKVFDFAVGRVGLTEAQARAAGYDVVTVLSPAPDKAHYYPTAKVLMMKLVVDRATRKLLGLQATGPGAADKRVDVAAMALTAGMTVDDLAKADLSYAPPYSPAMDNLITACDIARNKLDGIMEGLSPAEVREKLNRGDDFVFLDVRTPAEWDEVRLPDAVNIPLGALRSRAEELPKDKEIVAFCKISLRGYEAALTLQSLGYTNIKVLDGGVVMWPYEKVKPQADSVTA